MNAAFIRELQENVAKYGKQNVTTLLMVQAIKVIQIADAERDRLKAANAELEKALDVLVDVLDDGENNAPEHRCYVEGAWRLALNEARAALKKHKGETV